MSKSLSLTQSDSIVRQTNKRSSYLSYTTMNNKHIFCDILEIYLAKINNIFPASNHLLTKSTQKMFSETFKHTYNYQEKNLQVFQPRSISRALSRTHPELILGSFKSLILDKTDLNREMLCL